MDYDYPLDYSLYTNEEVCIIIDFLSYIEDNLNALDKDVALYKYNLYRNTINSKLEQKRFEKEYLALSGINIYKIIEGLK